MIFAQWAEYRRKDGTTSAGWLRTGRALPRDLLGGDYWTQAARVVIAGLGRMLDEASTYTGTLMVGPFDAVTEGGSLPALLAQMPQHLLERYLGDAFAASGLGLRGLPHPAFTAGIRTATPIQVDAAMRIDREVERAWVEGVGALLSDPGALRALGLAYGARVGLQAPGEVESRFGFRALVPPPNAELRKCAAAFLAFSFVDERGAVAMSRQVGPSCDAMLEVAERPGPWPSAFASMTGRLRAALDKEAWV